MKILKPKAIIFDWNGTLVFNNEENLMKLLPNAFKVIRRLKELGIFVSVVSNTYSNFLNKIINKYQMQQYFLNVIGTRGDVDHKKPSKEVIDYALIGSQIDEVNPDTVWMIGDSMQDIQTAYNANLRPVIFGNELLEQILHEEGLEKNKKVIYLKNHLEFLKILEELE